MQEHDLDAFQSLFNQQITIQNYNKLPRHFQEYAKNILEMGRRVTFVIQEMQEGFGHAVYCARDAIGHEPFLLMLGDHLYRSNGEISCAEQLTKAYQQHATSVLGLRQTPEGQIANFGTVTGIWLEENHLLNVTEFVEKPTVDYARNNLQVHGIPDDTYLTVFGQYIIRPKLFDFLKEHISNNVRERGEFQLTSALDRLRQEDGFLGLMMDGHCYDLGLPESYLETLRAFRQGGTIQAGARFLSSIEFAPFPSPLQQGVP